MQPRLKRYKQFIEKEYCQGLLNNKSYSLAGFKPELKQKIKQRTFKRIIFSGMGCSAIVAEMVKGFFIEQKIPLAIEIVNDYKIDYFIEQEILKDKQTLVMINSEGGYSQEPIKFYEQIKKMTKNIIFLTSGGKLGQIAKQDKVSLIRWQLKNPDKDYAVLHAPEYFSNLLNIFFALGLIKKNYQTELLKTVKLLKKEFSAKKIEEAKRLAERLKQREIILVAAPLWHLTLLKLVAMHFNELTLASVHRNCFHEFTHCEVAAFTAPKTKLALIIFKDNTEDEYTKNKMQLVAEVLTKKMKAHKNREIIIINLKQKDFLEKFFFTLLLMQYTAYFLGIDYNLKSQDFIAEMSGKITN